MSALTIFPAKAIQKEDIPRLHFPRQEVLQSQEAIDSRAKALYYCMLLGNNFHVKVKILFETVEGACEVETTIWAVTETSVVLKGGVFIPINCIMEVRIF